MKFRATAFQISACFAMLFFLCGFGPVGANQDSADQVGSDFIVTAAPVYEPLAALHGQERFPKGAQLMFVHEAKAEPLLTNFAASADANVSFDAKSVLFAGKKNASDPWQVWELALADQSLRQLTSGTADAIRPLYLPGARFVYALAHTIRLSIECGVDRSSSYARRIRREPRDRAADLHQRQCNPNGRIGGRTHFV